MSVVMVSSPWGTHTGVLGHSVVTQTRASLALRCPLLQPRDLEGVAQWPQVRWPVAEGGQPVAASPRLGPSPGPATPVVLTFSPRFSSFSERRISLVRMFILSHSWKATTT